MIEYIRKRDGRMDRFDVNKIAGAIYKSFQATEAKYDLDKAIEVAHIVEEKLEARHTELPTVELVQDTVEETLIEKGFVRIAKAYILYRAERTRSRNRKSRLMRTLEEITFQDAKSSDLKEKMQMLMLMLLWEQCLNMVLRQRSNLMKCLFLTHFIVRLIKQEIFIFMIWIS